MTTDKIYRNQDYPLQVFVLDSGGLPIDLNDLNGARFFFTINKIEVEKHSIDVEAGFEVAIPGVEDNEIIVLLEGARTADWPKGLLEMRAEVKVNDSLYPDDGRLEVEVFQLGLIG